MKSSSLFRHSRKVFSLRDIVSNVPLTFQLNPKVKNSNKSNIKKERRMRNEELWKVKGRSTCKISFNYFHEEFVLYSGKSTFVRHASGYSWRFTLWIQLCERPIHIHGWIHLLGTFRVTASHHTGPPLFHQILPLPSHIYSSHYLKTYGEHKINGKYISKQKTNDGSASMAQYKDPSLFLR